MNSPGASAVSSAGSVTECDEFAFRGNPPDYPAWAAEAWTTFLDGPAEEVRRNAGRRPVPYNRVAWVSPVVTLKAGSPPG